METLPLPKHISGQKPMPLPSGHQLTIVGANGAGKTLFMKELMKAAGPRAYLLSALSASFPEKSPSKLPGSIDDLYQRRITDRPYMRSDALSELDKLCHLLFTDELAALLAAKARAVANNEPFVPEKTKLDILIAEWERIFPGNRILRNKDGWMFQTDSGDDPIGAMALSQGEKAVLYYMAATLYAMPNAVVFVDSPSLFMHPSILNTLWNSIESLRPDCTFVYVTVDADFVSTRTENVCIRVRGYDSEKHAWDYDVLPVGAEHDEILIDLLGSRRPMLFIEGDATHSLDFALYTLVFPEMAVSPLGSCEKVIETTRSFNDRPQLHYLQTLGIVDRDRRTQAEVEYLRRKQIMVPDVAEVENIFLLEDIIRTMAKLKRKDPDVVFAKVRKTVVEMFRSMHEMQALQHTRHRMKRDVEVKIDARFTCITALEMHIKSLVSKLRPREHYNETLKSFRQMIDRQDYASIIRVFNHKPMLGDCKVAELLGYPSKEKYIRGVLGAMKRDDKIARRLREAVRDCLHAPI